MVSHVEECVQVLALDQLRKLFPLLGLGVDPGGVVGTRVKKDHTLLGNVLEKRKKFVYQFLILFGCSLLNITIVNHSTLDTVDIVLQHKLHGAVRGEGSVKVLRSRN